MVLAVQFLLLLAPEGVLTVVTFSSNLAMGLQLRAGLLALGLLMLARRV
jgi:hypothetical protein